MKFFGQFLVDQKLIDESTLLGVLIRQVESTSSVAVIVYRNKLLTVSDQLRVFSKQWETGGEYRQTCIDLGLWSDTLNQEVKRQLLATRQPLGQILVAEGHLSLPKLTIALDDFIALRGKSTKTVGESTTSLRTTHRASQQASPKASAHLPLAAKYCDFFNDKMRQDILTALSGAEADGATAAAINPDLVKRIRCLAVTSKIVGMTVSGEIWDNFLVALNAGVTISCGQEAVEMAWTLRNSASSGTYEAACLSAQGLNAKYDTLIATIKSLRRS